MNIDLGKLEDGVKKAIATSAFVQTEVLEFLSQDEKQKISM